MRVFSYKIARDYGFAPNPFHGMCTLATCKPQVRTSAMLGDIVVGCGCVGNGLSGRIICILRVTGKCTFQEYWDGPEFFAKRPFFGGNKSRSYGDNIYHRDANGQWIQVMSHHSFEDGSINMKNLETDTGSDNIIWSKDFSYFGENAIEIPSVFRNFGGDDLYPLGRYYRSKFSDNFIREVDSWFRTLPRGYLGRPSAWA